MTEDLHKPKAEYKKMVIKQGPTRKITVTYDLDRYELPEPVANSDRQPKWQCPHCKIFTDWREEPLSCMQHAIEQAAAAFADQIDREILEELLGAALHDQR